jgi:hypothetical protein
VNDLAQTKLAEPKQMNWDSWESGASKWQAPPPALDLSLKPIVYYGIAQTAIERVSDFALNENGEPYLNFALEPVIITQGDYKGYTIRFVEASVKPFEKNGKPVNAHKLGNYLRACGLTAKPQTNDEYRAAVRMAQPKQFAFTLDWEASSKDTGEKIKGYLAFPDDPERPGQRKAILHAGDFYQVIGTDYKPTGALAQVKADVLFANARLRFFRDPAKGVK